MAGKKNPQLRQRVTESFDEPTDDELPDNTSGQPIDPPTDRKVSGPKPTPATDGKSGDDKPHVFTAPIHGSDGRTGSALFATAIARFDPRERRVQLSEHYVYSDRDFIRRGHF